LPTQTAATKTVSHPKLSYEHKDAHTRNQTPLQAKQKKQPKTISPKGIPPLFFTTARKTVAVFLQLNVQTEKAYGKNRKSNQHVYAILNILLNKH
jgi:hypothetical protein